VIQTARMWAHPFAYLQHCRRQYGPRFTLRATSRPPLVFLSEPAEINAVMVAAEKTLRPGEGGRAILPIVGERSFMLCDGQGHSRVRKSVVSAFGARAVERHAEMISAVAQRTLASWPVDTTIELHPRLRALTLEAMLRTLTGRMDGPLDNRLRSLCDGVLKMLAVTASVAFVEPNLRRGLGRRTWQEFLRDRARVDELLYALIDERRQAGKPACDVLGLLAAPHGPDRSPVSRMQSRDNIMSIVLAGHETTASQLAWAFQLLAHNPAVRERLLREIDAGAGEEYMTATLQEVLRHRCVFAFAIPRAVAEPLQIGAQRYDPPAQLLPSIYLLHHDARVYPDPHAFRPERFLHGPPDPRTWLPWGGGRKRCPGLHLAMLEMKIVLQTVLAHLTVEPAAKNMERPRWRSVIVTPHAGSRIILRPRRPYGSS
jgi:cytochrome P450